MTRLAVVGGGITGLAAAYEAVQHGVEVVVFEAGPRVGGKLQASTFAGQVLDEAADAFLARVPWAVELCDELGLTPRLTQPAARSAFVWSRGDLRRLPSSQLLGIPTDLDELAASGIVSSGGVEIARRDLDRAAPGPEGDLTIGAIVRDRLGDEVLDRLVGPLVGGINAGDVDRLSVRASAAQIAAAADAGGSLIAAAAAMRVRAMASPDAPVFHAPLGGMTELVGAIERAISSAADTRCEAPVERVDASPDGWLVGDDPTPFDRVVITTPAGVASRLVHGSPIAAAHLGDIDHASVALVSMAFDRDDIGHALDGSGFLVPSVENRFVTACSFSSEKWSHIGNDRTAVLRVSAGRDGDPAPVTDLDDATIVERMSADLADFIGTTAAPTEVRVSRWTNSFPQYRPGHLERVDEIDQAMAADLPGVAVAGAALRGLGVPACIQQGRAKVRQLLDH